MSHALVLVVCNGTYGKYGICPRPLLRVGDDFTGTIEVKCPRCRTVHTRTFTDGLAYPHSYPERDN